MYKRICKEKILSNERNITRARAVQKCPNRVEAQNDAAKSHRMSMHIHSGVITYMHLSGNDSHRPHAHKDGHERASGTD